MDADKVLNLVKETVEKLLPLMDVDATVIYEYEEGEEFPTVKVNFDGDNLGYLIGNRGGHMRSLQYVFSMLVNRVLKQEDEEVTRVYVHVDVGGYMQDKFDRLERLASQVADDVRVLGDFVDMEPMDPADRRIVHMVLQNFDDVKTESQGDGRDRYVRVLPA